MKKFFLFIAGSALVAAPVIALAQSAYPAPQVGPTTGMYRLYNPVTMNHLYTIDYSEAFDLRDSGTYIYEGVAATVFTTQVAGSVPLWRLYNNKLNKHAFVAGTSGLTALKRAGYRQEGVIGYILNNPQAYSPNANQAPRLYWLQNSKTRDWLLTESSEEAGAAKPAGYKESDSWYWVPN